MRHRFTVLVLSCLAFCPTLPANAVQEPAPKQTVAKLDHYGDPLPEGAIARLGSARFYHEGGLVAAAFSPDGEVIVGAGIGDKGGLSLRFWGTASGREHSRITLEDFDLHGLAFGPDGKSVFVGEQLGVAQYDRQSGKLLRRIPGPEGHAGPYQFALTSDGKTIAAIFGTQDSNLAISIQDTASGSERFLLRGQQGGGIKCSFSADGKRLMSSTNSERWFSPNKKAKTIPGSLCVWDVTTGMKIREIANDQCSVAFAPDGQKVAIQDQSGETRVVNVDTSRTICRFTAPDAALEFTPDSKALVAVFCQSNDPPVLWDAMTGKEIRRFKAQREGWQRFGGISSDGKLLAVILGDLKSDGSVILWNIFSGEPIYRNNGHLDTVTCVAFAPGGKLLASGSLDRTIRLWDPTTGKEVACLADHKSEVTAVAFSVDGKILASSSIDGVVCLWDTASGRRTATLDGPEHGAASLVFSRDRKTLVAGGKSPVVKVWDLTNNKEITCLSTGQDGSVFASSLDGKLAVSANDEMRDDLSVERLYLWRLGTRKRLSAIELRPLRNADDYHDKVTVWAAALSDNGRFVAAGHSRSRLGVHGTEYANHTLRVWERGTDEAMHYMDDTKVKALVFSQNGRFLAAGHAANSTYGDAYKDSRVTIWDMLTGESVRVCVGATSEITCVAFSQDGKMLASASADHTILIWSGFGPPPLKGADQRATDKQIESWWSDLKSSTATAKDATVQLVAHSDQSVKWLGEHLRAAPPVDTARIAQLIKGLDSDVFKERQKANTALEELADLAEPQLRQVLAGKPSLELRRRVELLLDKAAATSFDQIRLGRAIAALEWIATPQAEQLIANLAGGAPESRQTQLAKAALDRIGAARPR